MESKDLIFVENKFVGNLNGYITTSPTIFDIIKEIFSLLDDKNIKYTDRFITDLSKEFDELPLEELNDCYNILIKTIIGKSSDENQEIIEDEILDTNLFNINNLIEETINDTKNNMAYRIEDLSKLNTLITHLSTVKDDLNDIIKTNYKPSIKQSIKTIEIVNDGLFRDFENILKTYNKPNLYKPIALLLQMYVKTDEYYIKNIEQQKTVK